MTSTYTPAPVGHRPTLPNVAGLNREPALLAGLTKQENKLAPETPNPYQPPETPGSMQPQTSSRPNFFDWFFAIFLSLIAASLVFPTTCFGGFMVIWMAEDVFGGIHYYLPVLLLFGLLIACVVLTVLCAFWVARSYLKAVRKNAAKTNSNPKNLKL